MKCPNCQADLLPVAFCEDVWGCKPCRETWHVPAGTKPAPWIFKDTNKQNRERNAR